MSCRGARKRIHILIDWSLDHVYVCNCNGINETQVRAAIEAGAERPCEIFHRCQTRPRCAKCVCDMRRMIQDRKQTLRYAAE